MNKNDIFMAFPQPQHEAIFLRRPQRFLAEMRLGGGVVQLVYCANSGAMTGCLASGKAALVWESNNHKRKLRYTWRAVEFEGIWIGTDTHLTNRIIEQALTLRLIPGLEVYSTIVREKIIETGFRVDFLLSGLLGECLLEVKTCAIVELGVARYPDSSTPRGVNQLRALTRQATQGKRSVLLFLVQRADAHSFMVSSSYDAAYAAAFDEAVAAGVEIMAFAVSVSPAGFGLPRLLPYAGGAMLAMRNLISAV